jgi:predicted Ser/Thr protein kinase
LEGVTASLAAGIGGEIVVGHAPLVELECERLAVVAPDRYLLGRELARGGMGRILEAVDTRHDRPVAIKLGLTSSPQAVRRFVREALVTARLQHPAIVPVYEVGRWPSGEPFYVMKRVEGRSLDAVIRAATGDRRSLLGHVVPVIEALAYAHAHGVIHRDLKPSNVLVGAYGEVMVIDWGLARVAGDAEGAAGLGEPTQTVGALGTPMYMSPEQARGETVGPAADVYALGVVLYFALSGRAPYDGVTGKAVLAQVLAGAPPAIDTVAPGLPPDLATIVKRAMARDPADRYPGAQALAEDLRRFMTGELVRAHSYSAWSLLARWARRNRTLVAVSAIALAAVAAVATASVARIARERDAAQAARLATAAHRDSAEKLVGGVLSQLVSRLERDGRLDLLAGTAALIDEYYAAVRASRLNRRRRGRPPARRRAGAARRGGGPEERPRPGAGRLHPGCRDARRARADRRRGHPAGGDARPSSGWRASQGRNSSAPSPSPIVSSPWRPTAPAPGRSGARRISRRSMFARTGRRMSARCATGWPSSPPASTTAASASSSPSRAALRRGRVRRRGRRRDRRGR